MNALPQNLANMLAMKKPRDADAYSTYSVASRGSDHRRGKAPPSASSASTSSSSRFSLRRMFRRRSSASARAAAAAAAAAPSSSSSAARMAKSASELETRSLSSVQTSGGVGSGERDPALHSMSSSSDETASTGRGGAAAAGGGGGVGAGAAGGQAMECPLCLAQQPEEHFPLIMTCHHRSCQDCLRQYLRIEIMESRVNIACPECSEKFHPNDIKMILAEDELMSKYETFMLRRVMVSEPDARWCPAPDCGYAVIATGCASCPKLRCERPGCDTHFCYHCKQHWHPNQTCDAARAERAAHLRSASISYSHESSAQNEIKPCPRCGAFIIKMDDGSCNHMTCAVCGAEFCWLCMKEISDLHYLSPSGCTFWGKKPWSRKKKILWQLGTLVGAPVGISLLASIAVPAMIIGIPIWVGRKLHTKYQFAAKHHRNLVITGGVSASILISPILAGFAVGIGVPILLAYVYGVVPISLCRSGGCGVTTTNKGGVRFEFDDDNDVTVGVSGPYTGTAGDAHSVETTSHHVTNPSIGPSIGEMSVGMTNSLSASGSHMDRVGVIRDESDRDSASNRAIAGASLNGSLCGSAVAGPSGFQNRLEVHADIATNTLTQKRNSLSSESATVSLDAKSATVSFGDDASTKALAGSICNSRCRHESTSSSQQAVAGAAAAAAGIGAGSEGGASAACARAGSPTSGRSVNFEDTYLVGQAGSRSKRYKRHSLSVGDRIHEHAEVASAGGGGGCCSGAPQAAERLSVRSLTGDDAVMHMAVAQVDVNANGGGLGSSGGCCGRPPLPWLQEVSGSQSTHSSASFGSASSASSSAMSQGAGSGCPRGVPLPEVADDRPVGAVTAAAMVSADSYLMRPLGSGSGRSVGDRSSGESSTDTALTATSTDRLHHCDSSSSSSSATSSTSSISDDDEGHVDDTDSFPMVHTLKHKRQGVVSGCGGGASDSDTPHS